MHTRFCSLFCLGSALFTGAALGEVDELRIEFTPAMISSSSTLADFSGLADEQAAVAEPPAGEPKRGWDIPSQYWRDFPYSATIDLKQARNLSCLWFYDTNGIGPVTVSAGDPAQWQTVCTVETKDYLRWSRVALDVTTRYLRIELQTPGANLAEVVLYEYTPAAHQAMLARQAAAAREAAERAAAERAAQEALDRRPWIELAPFGKVRLVDEVPCAAPSPEHQFREYPPQASRTENVLGRACRILQPQSNQCAYVSYRLGKWKLLKPGAAYVLVVEYPEDQPRSMVVMNGGNETTRGFHTGATIGDALHPKYVNNHPESLRLPLSGRYEIWSQFFHLHDRFPDLEFLRGAKPRKLSAADGFDVTIAQFSAHNDPLSQGAALASIRLYEVADVQACYLPLRLPPDGLPRRRIFWREEMADGVIESAQEQERGVKNPLDWYRFKASQMHFLGINTYTKDLLEFGACQHWDSTPHGGNQWVHFAYDSRELWGQIVELMGKHGFDVLPYYEYAGSKGDRGLGYERRCQPLTRDDAYTHITWVESANADLTDPETYRDFQKMLDLTVVRMQDKARFAGIWLRPRWQLPMSFADATRERFAREVRNNQPVSREDLRRDAALLRSYEEWWFGKRREFLVAMRDYLRQHGQPDAFVLYTAEGSESGTSFPTWEKRLVTDDVTTWQRVLSAPEHIIDQKRMVAMAEETVVEKDLYLEALQAAQLNWGDWEVPHANPPADPQRYHDTPGVLLTHGFNRRYTVASPKTFAAFRGASGLAIVRHYALNEDMMFDAREQPTLGYFVADVERAGPYCMLAETLAVAQGDPTMIGYLTGSNFARGFPRYVRDFHAAFLALPALPSERLPEACSDREVVVRRIPTSGAGTYYAIVNTGCTPKSAARITLPAHSSLRNAATGAVLSVRAGSLELDLYPCQLQAIHGN
jgi:hypothetical protein